jgi:hypothetical protein
MDSGAPVRSSTKSLIAVPEASTPAKEGGASASRWTVSAEHMCQKPRPSVSSRWLWVLVVVETNELELIADRGRRAERIRITRRARDDFFTVTRMAREDPEISDQVKSRRRDRGDEAEHQVFGRKHDRARAVFPDTFELKLERAVGAQRESVLRNRGARHVPGESFEPAAIATIDALPSVHIDAAHLGDGVVGVVGWKLWIRRDDEPQRRQPRAVAGDADALRGSGVASGEARLRVAELGRLGAEHLGVERAARLAEDFLDARRRALRDGRDLGARRRTESVEDESIAVLVSDIHAIHRQNVEMYVQPQSRVRTLHAEHGPGVRVGDAPETERRLRSFLQGAGARARARRRDLGSALSVVAE